MGACLDESWGGGGGGSGGEWMYMSSLLKRLKVVGNGNFKVTHDKYNTRGM